MTVLLKYDNAHFIYLLDKFDSVLIDIQEKYIQNTYKIDGFLDKDFILCTSHHKMRYILTNIYHVVLNALKIRNNELYYKEKSKLSFLYDTIFEIELLHDVVVDRHFFENNAYFVMKEIMYKGLYNPLCELSEMDFEKLVNRIDEAIFLPLDIFKTESNYVLFSVFMYYLVKKQEVIIDSYLFRKISNLLKEKKIELFFAFKASDLSVKNMVHMISLLDDFYKIEIIQSDKDFIKFRFRNSNNIGSCYTISFN